MRFDSFLFFRFGSLWADGSGESDVPVELIRIRSCLVYFAEDPGGIVVGCREGGLETEFIGLWDLHGMDGHMHVVLGNERHTAFCSQLGLEAVAVVEVAVVFDGNLL